MSSVRSRRLSDRGRSNRIATPKPEASDDTGGLTAGDIVSAADLANKLRRGLTLRLDRIQRLQDENSAQVTYPGGGSGDGTSSRVLELGRRPRDNRDGAHWLFVSTALALPTIKGQVQTVESISPSEQVAFDVTYAVGAVLAPQLPSIGQLFAASDEEFSIVLESMARFGADLGLASAHRESLVRQTSQFVREALREHPGPETSLLDEFPRRLGNLARSTRELDGLARFRHFVTIIKRSYHDLLGPDVTSALQALTDPAMSMSTRQLEATLSVMRDWGLERTFYGLLLIRLLGPNPNDRAFLSTHFGDLAKLTTTMAQKRMLAAMIHGPKAKTVRPRAAEFTPRLVWLYHRLHVALSGRQGRLLIDALVDLYCLDPVLIGFLDWRNIQNVLRDHPPGGDARTAFVTFLMNDDAVRSNFPLVALAMGKGALISDITSMIDPRRRNDSINSLLVQFRTLPERAARDLTLVFLERPIMERVASALPRPRNWPRELPPVDSARVSMVRLESLHAAVDRGLIAESTAKAFARQEIDHLRTQYFQRRMRTGRVRIPWEDIERTVKEMAEADLPALKILGQRPPNGFDVADLLPRLARFIAHRITDHVVYESEVGVDQALSNNLRHGIVVPRFLRAFDDAFQTTAQRKSLPAWDETTLQQTFGPHGEQLIDLRDYVSEAVKQFVDVRLTVAKGDPFDYGLRKAITERVSSHMLGASGGARADRLGKSVGAIARRHIKKHLSAAGRYLTEKVQRAVMAELRAVRSRLRASPSPMTGTFLDCLESNLHEAFGEAKQWIGITQAYGDAIPFKLAEVVKIHLLSTSLSAWDKLNVQTNCIRQQEGKSPIARDFSITGKYLELLQEVVHNLLSNAFKYSGENLKTIVNLELTVQDRSLTIRCMNSIAEAAVNDVSRQHANTVALAKAQASDQARRDQVSGFQKIRRAFHGALNRQPHINIPPVSATTRRFLVEITIDHPGDFLAESE